MMGLPFVHLLVTLALLVNNCLLLGPHPPSQEHVEVGIVARIGDIDNDESVEKEHTITKPEQWFNRGRVDSDRREEDNTVFENDGEESDDILEEESLKRKKRACPDLDSDVSTTTDSSNITTTTLKYDGPTGPSLGQILGVVTVFCTVFYAIGITYKLIKIWRGEYEAEEPVYLKYK